MAVPPKDLRAWIDEASRLGQCETVLGADWNLEIGTISEMNYRRSQVPALLFDRIKDAEPGFRVLTAALCSPERVALTFGLPVDVGDRGLVAAIRSRMPRWDCDAAAFPPVEVDAASSAVNEVVQRGGDVDLSAFPTPLWHEHDGGRYIGTGSAVITRDPETAAVNVGCYRVMQLNGRQVTIHVGTGKHGRAHYERYWEKGEPCPVAVSIGHDPALFAVAAVEIPFSVGELDYLGGIRGEPVATFRSEVTGLPIPADAEAVLEGWIRPAETCDHEGPFGEWTGYYTEDKHLDPVLEVACLRRRRDPIILGVPPGKPPHDFSYYRSAFKSAMIHDALEKAGVRDVKAVWAPESGGGRLIVVVSIRQRYFGHVKQAGLIASQCQAGAFMGRYVVVVDDDIDPTNMDEVMWALATRSDPEQDIDISRKTWGARGDPMNFDHRTLYNSRAIIDACKPFEHLGDFSRVAISSPETLARITERWRGRLPWMGGGDSGTR